MQVKPISEALENCHYEVSERRAGEMLTIQGTHSDSLYVLLDGRAEVWRTVGDRTELLDDVHPGDAIGEVCLVAPGPATATVRTVTTSMVIRVSHRRLEGLWGSAPRIASNLHGWALRVIAGRLRSATPRQIRGAQQEHASWTS